MNRIREIRNKSGMTLPELSKKLKEYKDISISGDAISKYERGEREPKLKLWEALASLFQVSVPYIQGIDDKKHNSSMDLADALDKHEYMTYQGKPIDDEDLKLIKEILRKQDK